MGESLSLTLPEYGQERIDALIAEMGQYAVNIPTDPATIGGYAGINNLFSVIQGYQNRVQEIVAHAINWNAVAKAVYEARKMAYQAKRVAMLSDKRQGEYESFKVLEAEVDHALADDIKEMQRAKLIAGLFGAFLEQVQGKQKNLADIKETLNQINNNWKRQNPLPPAVFQGKVV